MSTVAGAPVSYEEWRVAYGFAPERDVPFSTLSGEEVAPLYTERDLAAGVGASDDPIGLPGQYPFTRGVYASMYRGRLWTMRQFAGFGTAAETNRRFQYLLGAWSDGPEHGVRYAVADGP